MSESHLDDKGRQRNLLILQATLGGAAAGIGGSQGAKLVTGGFTSRSAALLAIAVYLAIAAGFVDRARRR